MIINNNNEYRISNLEYASGIVISSLRENLGASVQTLGDTSYGKGNGQIYIETPLGGYMATTCCTWIRCVHLHIMAWE